MMSVWTKFRSALRAFRVARGGNVAITFVFATLPIIAGVGFAVDYSRANAVKVAMQAALDSTALMLSKEAATDTAGRSCKRTRRNISWPCSTAPEAKNVTVTANYTTTGGTPGGRQRLPPMFPPPFLAVIGCNTITVGNSSTAKWGSIAAARGAGARQHRIDGRQPARWTRCRRRPRAC